MLLHGRKKRNYSKINRKINTLLCKTTKDVFSIQSKGCSEMILSICSEITVLQAGCLWGYSS